MPNSLEDSQALFASATTSQEQRQVIKDTREGLRHLETSQHRDALRIVKVGLISLAVMLAAAFIFWGAYAWFVVIFFVMIAVPLAVIGGLLKAHKSSKIRPYKGAIASMEEAARRTEKREFMDSRGDKRTTSSTSEDE